MSSRGARRRVDSLLVGHDGKKLESAMIFQRQPKHLIVRAGTLVVGCGAIRADRHPWRDDPILLAIGSKSEQEAKAMGKFVQGDRYKVDPRLSTVPVQAIVESATPRRTYAAVECDEDISKAIIKIAAHETVRKCLRVDNVLARRTALTLTW
jgi:hypothetical protein